LPATDRRELAALPHHHPTLAKIWTHLGEQTENQRKCRGANGVASATLSEHQKHTEFLRQCILYDESARRQDLHEGISRIQRDARCVQRAVWLMAMLTALTVAGLGYGMILVDNFPYNLPQFIIDLVCALGLGSLISLLAFMGLGMVYRMKLDQRREECRQLVARLLESRLGKPVTTPLRDRRDNRVGAGDDRTVRVASENNAFPVRIESAARG
jgi:hypothetical protein